jgi:hypothetical protein
MAAFTQTTHAVWIPEQWSDEVIVSLESNLVLVKLSKEIKFNEAVKGDILHEPTVSDLVVNDLSESDADIAGQTVTESDWSITVNKSKHVTVYIPKHLGAKFSKYEFRAPYTKKIGYALGKQMDTDLYALWLGFANKVGTTADGLEGNISDAMLLKILEFLDTNDVNEEDRYLVFPSRQKSKLLALDKFVRADAIGNGSKIEKAKFGEIYGMTCYFTNNAPTKLAATAPATVVDSLVGMGMHKEALAIAIPQNVDIDYAYLPQKKAWILSGDCLYGVAEYRDVCGVPFFTKKTG